MSTPRTRKPKARPAAKPAPDPKLLLARLEKEAAGLERWHKRLVRTFHAYERQHRLVARRERRITKLKNA